MNSPSPIFKPSRYMLAKCKNSYTASLTKLATFPYTATMVIDTILIVFKPKPNWNTAAESRYILKYHLNELNVRFESYEERQEAKLNFLALLSILPQEDIDTYISTFLPMPSFSESKS